MAGALPGLPHFAPKAKHVIYLFQNGAPTHVELFDYKPQLQKYSGQPIPDSFIEGRRFAFMSGDVLNPELREFSAEISAHAVMEELPRASDLTVRMTFRNSGSQAWPALGRRAVRVAYHWLDQHGDIIEFEGLRTPLPHDLAPGESVTLACFVRTPESPGALRLRWPSTATSGVEAAGSHVTFASGDSATTFALTSSRTRPSK